MKRVSRLNEYLQNILLGAGAVTLFFFSLEFALRPLTAHGIVKSYSPMMTQLERGTEDWRLAHITADEFREPDPILFWRPIASSPYTSQRFKGPKVTIPKPKGVYRIICYGDSNTDGPPVGSWPEILQKILNRNSGQRGGEYEVLNAGVAGYSSHQGLMRFRQDAEVYQPDLIFVSFGWNDLALTRGAPDKHFRPPHWALVGLERVFLKYHFYRVFKYYLGLIMKPSYSSANLGPRVSLEDYPENLKGFLETARAHSVSVVFLTRPYHMNRLRGTEDMIIPWWVANLPLYNGKLLRFAKSNGAVAVDIQKIFETRYLDLFSDECHFNLEGRRRMAEILSEKIDYFTRGLSS